MQLVEGWITTCRSTHVSCRARVGLQIPTRLLDIGDDSSKMVKMVPGATARDAHYAAWGYCWGQKPQFLLLRSNYKELENGIPFNSLFNVAQDAITVCRALSIQYLWMDSMCIIQGPDGEFLQEAARMEDVYAGSLITIVAAGSRDQTQHFLRHRNPLQWMECQLRIDGTYSYRTYVEGLTFCDYLNNTPGSFAIDTQGCCFQERLLAPRSVYFGENGLHWECRTGLACEYFPEIGAQHDPTSVEIVRYSALKSTYATMNELAPDFTSPFVSGSYGAPSWRAILRLSCPSRQTSWLR